MISSIKCSRGIVRNQVRSYFGSAQASTQIRLDEEIPNIPATRGSQPAPEVNYSALSNGIKVGSDSSYGSIASITVHVKAGSSYENDQHAGSAHLLEKMAFRCTNNRSDLRLYRDIEAIGGTISSNFNRNTVSYGISVLADKASQAVEILAESVLDPKFADWDVALRKKTLKTENAILLSNPSFLLSEAVHAAAFRGSPLGRSLISSDNIDKLDASSLKAYHAENFTASGLAITGVGMDHDSLVKLSEAAFKSAASRSSSTSSKYRGGEFRHQVSSPITYIALGFEGASLTSKHVAVSYVLKHLLLKSGTTAFNALYPDAGVFGLMGQSAAENSGDLVHGLLENLKKFAETPVSAGDLQGAKAVSIGHWASHNDSIKGRQDHLAYNVLHSSNVVSNSDIYKATEAVTVQDVQNFAQKLLKSKPSVASVGNVSKVPYYDEVVQKLQ